MTLTLAGGQKVGVKQDLLALISGALFNRSGLNIKFNEKREITAVFLTSSKIFDLHLYVYELICFKRVIMIDTIHFYISTLV